MDKKMIFPCFASLVAMVATIFCYVNSFSKNDVSHSIELNLGEEIAPLLTLIGANSAAKDGVNGQDGKDGVNGRDGKDGLNGQNGLNGKTAEFSVENGVLCWRYIGETEWKPLYEFGENSGDSEDGSNNTGGSGSGDSDPDGGNEDIGLDVFDVVVSVNDSSTDFGCLANNQQCVAGTKMDIKVNDTEVYSFYVIDDTNGLLTLISASNIGNSLITTVKWNDASAADTSYGPVSLLTTLSNLTANWTNISYIDRFDYDNYSFLEDEVGYRSISITNGIANITDVNGNVALIEGAGFRARLLTYEEAFAFKCDSYPTDEPDGVIDEADSFICDRNNDGEINELDDNPTWLYGNLDGENYSLRPYGYWLLSSKSSSKVYNVRNNGTIKDNSAIDASGRGIRPVITIKK